MIRLEGSMPDTTDAAASRRAERLKRMTRTGLYLVTDDRLDPDELIRRLDASLGAWSAWRGRFGGACWFVGACNLTAVFQARSGHRFLLRFADSMARTAPDSTLVMHEVLCDQGAGGR